jgi:peptidoglycan/LPS O-acetylase OafA/YrhL
LKLKYEPALDGLRGFAVLAVMGFHFAMPLVPRGDLGVDVFFVLSGYLITSILVSEIAARGSIDYKVFWIRRVRRLVPALVVLLTAYAVFTPFVVPELASRIWLDIATAMFFVTNLRETFWSTNTPLSHTWTLAIEEQFYLVWPFVVTILARVSRLKAAVILCVVWAFLTAARIAWHMKFGDSANYFTPLHATGLILGSALALYPIRSSAGTLALALLTALVFLGRTSVNWLVPIPVAEICTALVISNPHRLLKWAPLCFLGEISYGIYLWHLPISWVFKPTSIFGILSLFPASALAGWLSYVLVERRFFRRDITGVKNDARI